MVRRGSGWLIIAAFAPHVYCFGGEVDKSRRAEAKRIAAEAAKAEKRGDLVAARQEYLRSENLSPNKYAEYGLERVIRSCRVKVKHLVADSQRAYQAHDPAPAKQLLRTAAELEPANGIVAYDLALIEHMRGNREEAVELLALAAAAARDGNKRDAIEQLSSAILSGAGTATVTPVAAKQLTDLNAQLRARQTQELSGTAYPGEELCRQYMETAAAMPAIAAVQFNAARCAEYSGDYGRARNGFTEYLRIAPTALDAAEVRLRIELLDNLLSIGGDQGETVRRLFGSAQRNVEAGHYEDALRDYEQAAAAAPNTPALRRHVAVLVQAQGDVERAAVKWQELLASDPSPETREEVRLILERLPEQRREYDLLVAEARAGLLALVRRRLLDGATVTAEYGTARLQALSEPVQKAAFLFPLEPKVNLLQAFLSSQTNNIPTLRRSFDALAAAHVPMPLYMSLYDTKKKRATKYGRLEIAPDSVKFAVIAQVRNDRGNVKRLRTPLGPDGLGNFAESQGLQAQRFEGLSATVQDVKKLETREGSVYLEVDKSAAKESRLLMRPVSLTGLGLPPTGPGARQFANNYTRIVGRYVGVDGAKLGKESLTTWEKVKLGYNVATIGLQVYMTIGNPLGALELVQQVRRFSKTIRVANSRVHRLALEQEQVIDGLPFKMVPVQPAPLVFRTE